MPADIIFLVAMREDAIHFFVVTFRAAVSCAQPVSAFVADYLDYQSYHRLPHHVTQLVSDVLIGYQIASFVNSN